MGTIAISTCAFTDVSLKAALERIGCLTSAAEVRWNARHALETPARRQAVLDSGLRCSLHAPEDIPIWSTSESMRRAAIDTHRRVLEAGAEAGVSLYLVHPDYSERPIQRSPETRAALGRSFADLHDLEEDYAVRVVVENMPGTAHTHFAGPDIDLHGLGLGLDAGHALISGTLAAFVGTWEIAHLHLHDNDGQTDAHLPLGRGSLPRDLLQLALEQCEGMCVLEHQNEAAAHKSLAFLSTIVRCKEVA